MDAIWLALTLTTIVTNPIVTVRGSTHCPSSQDVAARLVALLPAITEARAPDVAELKDDGPLLRVTLRGPKGALMGRRGLRRGFSCADLAAAVGVVIATWESDVHPEFKLEVSGDAAARGADPARSPPHTSTTPPPLIGPPPAWAEQRSPAPAPARPAPATPPAIAEALPRHRAASAVPLAPPLLAVTPSPDSVAGGGSSVARASEVELGVGVAGVLAPAGDAADSVAAMGGLIALAWTRAGRDDGGWGAHTSVMGTTERSAQLLTGVARWRRYAIALGPHRRWVLGSGRWLLDAHAEALGALLSLRGAGFSSNLSDTTLDPGVGGGARLAYGQGRLRPWADVATTGWPRRQVVYERPTDHSANLPRFEAMLILGVSCWLQP